MQSVKQNAVKSDATLSITRVFDATAERVFDAWLDPAQFAQWIGPRSFQVKADLQLLEPRVGGKYRIYMKMPNGENTVGGVYKEIVRPTKLVFTWTWVKHSGDCGAAPTGVDSMAGLETLVTVTFRAIGKKTEMTLLHESLPNVEQREGHNKGWSSTFEQLAEYLGGAVK